MPIKEIPKSYRASDGEEFGTKQEAERHEAFIVAQTALQRAIVSFNDVLARTQKIGDGSLFQCNYGHYWYLTDPIFRMPELVRVLLNGYGDQFETMPNGKMRVGSTRYIEGQNNRVDWFEFDRLFKDEVKGRVALLAAREKWLEEAIEQVEETRNQVAKIQEGQDD